MNPPQRPHTVLFASVHNGEQSKMAAAWLNQLGEPAKVRALSAGTQLAERVHPVVVEAMREVGIDLGSESPRLLTLELAAQVDLLSTILSQN